jgi:hypothetical protein
MKSATAGSGRVFSVEEANRMLPLVRAIVSDLVQLADEVTERRHRLNHLLFGRDRDAKDTSDMYAAELAEVERGVERDTKRLRDYVEELRQLGVEPKGHDGLVDFPSIVEGRRVYLCWKLGESEVLFWHEVDEGFASRQPLTTGSGFAAAGEGQPERANSLGD